MSKFDIEEREVLYTLAACLNTDPSADDSRNENKEHQGPDDTDFSLVCAKMYL